MADPSNWQSLFQGGLGVRLPCGTATANVAVPGASVVNQMIVTNMGNNAVFVKVGDDATLAATTSCYPLLPGYSLVLPISGYVAGITESSTSELLINTGNGAPS